MAVAFAAIVILDVREVVKFALKAAKSLRENHPWMDRILHFEVDSGG